MTPERWRQIKEVFHLVLECEPDQWPSLLAATCGADEEMRREVESLLKAHRAAEGFLELSALDAAEAASSVLGKRIGAYRILREIGRGGMGAVYLARRDDDQYRKEVAVKLIKRGMDTDFVLRRFRHERQILAQLEHPNIARLLDGGTTPEGQPYFVMEHVRGEPIDAYCTTHGLSVPQRLQLFHTVCAAVQHAHQNLAIHRDLKPGNILVAPDGTPKLLDFGLAKLLTPDLTGEATTATAVALHALTPEYASPEQIRGEPLTTATDVYSLGVLLYELLTGRKPYRFPSRSPDEIARTVCEREPERPSASLQRLRGDLDNIVLKALAKEPHRRYASVEQFAEDVRRFLEGRPVLARPDTWRYRAGKFARRNRVGVAAAALVLLSLLGGVAATAWQARVAQAERARADRRFNDVRSLASSFLFEFHDAIAPLPGATPARELVVQRAVEYLDRLAGDVGNGDVSLQRELALAYERVGRIQGNSYYSNLGNTDAAMASYGKALEIQERLARSHPADGEIRAGLAIILQGVGDMQYSMNDLEAGARSYQRSLDILEALAAEDPSDESHREALAGIHTRLGDIKGMEGYPNLGDTEGALRHYQAALELRRALADAAPEDPDARVALAQTLSFLGSLRRATGDARQAIDHGREAVRLLESVSARDPSHTGYVLELLSAYTVLRLALVDDLRQSEALVNTRRTVEMLEALSAADPRNVQMRRNLSVSYNALGADLLAVGDVEGAIAVLRRTVEINQALAAADPSSSEHPRDVSFALQLLGEAQAASGDHQGALRSYRRSIGVLEGLLSETSRSARDQDELASARAGAGSALLALGDVAGALSTLRRAVTEAEAAAAGSPANVGIRARLAQRYFETGGVYERAARGEGATPLREACVWYRRSAETWEEIRRQGALRRADVATAERVARAVASCDPAGTDDV